MLLVLQLIFAAIATHKGHGFTPWMYMIVGYGSAFGLGMVFYAAPEIAYGIGVVIGLVLVVVLGYMAFTPQEGN